MEAFQERFAQHTQSTRPQRKTVARLGAEGGEGSQEGGGEDGAVGSAVAPLVPEEVMTKLMGKPGEYRCISTQ